MFSFIHVQDSFWFAMEIVSISLAIMDNAVIKCILYLLMKKKIQLHILKTPTTLSLSKIQSHPYPWTAWGRAALPASFSSRDWVSFKKTLGCADGNLDNSGVLQWIPWVLNPVFLFSTQGGLLKQIHHQMPLGEIEIHVGLRNLLKVTQVGG